MVIITIYKRFLDRHDQLYKTIYFIFEMFLYKMNFANRLSYIFKGNRKQDCDCQSVCPLNLKLKKKNDLKKIVDSWSKKKSKAWQRLFFISDSNKK